MLSPRTNRVSIPHGLIPEFYEPCPQVHSQITRQRSDQASPALLPARVLSRTCLLFLRIIRQHNILYRIVSFTHENLPCDNVKMRLTINVVSSRSIQPRRLDSSTFVGIFCSLRKKLTSCSMTKRYCFIIILTYVSANIYMPRSGPSSRAISRGILAVRAFSGRESRRSSNATFNQRQRRLTTRG
jgi:hypothetical protein